MPRRKKTPIEAQAVPIEIASPDGEDVQVEVIAPDEPPKRSLKERLFGASFEQAPKKKAPTRAKKTSRQEEMIKSILPLVASGFVATYGQYLLPEEYRLCAPSVEETSGILAPLFNILSRRIEVYGEISQDAIDIIIAAIAATTYGTRAVGTYLQLRDEIRNSTNASSGTARPRTGHDDKEVQKAKHGNGSNTISQDNLTENGNSEVDLIADMLNRDRSGRVRLGLLPE